MWIDWPLINYNRSRVSLTLHSPAYLSSSSPSSPTCSWSSSAASRNPSGFLPFRCSARWSWTRIWSRVWFGTDSRLGFSWRCLPLWLRLIGNISRFAGKHRWSLNKTSAILWPSLSRGRSSAPWSFCTSSSPYYPPHPHCALNCYPPHCWPHSEWASASRYATALYSSTSHAKINPHRYP